MPFSRTALVLLALCALASAQDLPIRSAQDSGQANRIDLRVVVDATVEFSIQGARIRYDASGSKEPRDDGSEYAAGLPYGPVQNLRVKRMDGRGSILLEEQPSAANNWTLKLRISDPKGGEDRYHARITWDAAQAPSAPAPAPVVITELSAAADGRGTLSAGGRQTAITQAQLTLAANKTWILGLPGANNARFRGTWEQADAGAVSLKLTGAWGAQGATGAGSVWIAEGRATHIGLDGTAPGQGSFKLQFDQSGAYRDFVDPNRSLTTTSANAPVAPKGPGRTRRPAAPAAPPPPAAGGFGNYESNEIVAPRMPSRRAAPVRSAPRPDRNRGTQSATQRGVRELVVTLDGNGFIESDRLADDQLAQVFVRLREGGAARFEFDGQQTWTVEGRWTQPEPGRLAIAVSRVNSSASQASGSVWLNGNAVERIEVEGTSSRTGDFRVRMFVK